MRGGRWKRNGGGGRPDSNRGRCNRFPAQTLGSEFKQFGDELVGLVTRDGRLVEDSRSRCHSREAVDFDDDGFGPPVFEYPHEGIDAAVALHAEEAGGPFQVGFDLAGNVFVAVVIGGQAGGGEVLPLPGQEFLFQAEHFATGQGLAGFEDLKAQLAPRAVVGDHTTGDLQEFIRAPGRDRPFEEDGGFTQGPLVLLAEVKGTAGGGGAFAAGAEGQFAVGLEFFPLAEQAYGGAAAIVHRLGDEGVAEFRFYPLQEGGGVEEVIVALPQPLGRGR